MIRVTLAAEPQDFEQKVREPGRKFLALTPKPTSKQWAAHRYWRHVLPSLHDSYRGICAYSCHWIPYDTGADTVEHFRPKDKHPQLAYDWMNYRFVCATLNGRKGIEEDVLDPFDVTDGWFALQFPSMLVVPGDDIEIDVLASVRRTIDRLRLNDEGTCLKSRVKWVSDYANGGITFDHLVRHAPFIGRELERQDLVDGIKSMFCESF